MGTRYTSYLFLQAFIDVFVVTTMNNKLNKSYLTTFKKPITCLLGLFSHTNIHYSIQGFVKYKSLKLLYAYNKHQNKPPRPDLSLHVPFPTYRSQSRKKHHSHIR